MSTKSSDNPEPTLAVGTSEMVSRRLLEINSGYEKGFSWQMQELFKLGCFALDLEAAVLARVERKRFQVMELRAPEGWPWKRREVVPLDETFCRLTVEGASSFHFRNLKEKGLSDYPAAGDGRVQSYLGYPLEVDGDLYGTLSFLGSEPREREFDTCDLDCGQMMAQWVATELSRRAHEDRLRRKNAKLRQLTKVDPLTELPNRNGMQETVERIARRYPRQPAPVSAVLVDIDQLSRINEDHGVSAGDEVIISVAATIRSVVRPIDIVGRIGGDHFLVVMIDTTLENAEKVARRIEEAVEQDPIRIPTGSIHVTLSMGLTAVGDRAHSVDDIIENTEEQLRQSRHGR